MLERLNEAIMVKNTSGFVAIVGCSVAIFWPGAFIFGFPGVMASHWQEAFQVGKGAIGNVLFFVLASLGVFMFLVGRLQERIGIHNMITLGALLCAVNVLLLPFASNIYAVYLWAFIMGTASCFVYIPALTTVQRWFPGRMGLVSGFVNLVFGISGAFMAPLFTYMLTHLGYAPMTMLLGFLSLITGTVAGRLTAPPPTETIAHQAAGSHDSGIIDAGSLSARQSVSTKSFWFLSATWTLQGAAGIAMVTLSTSYGLSKGFSLEKAVMVLTAFNLASGISRLASGFISDVHGRNITMSVTFLAAGASYLIMGLSHDLALIAVLAGFVGFAFGTLVAVSAPLVVDCFGMKHFGSVFGLVFASYGFLAGPLGPSLAGYLLDSTNGNYSVVFAYLGVFCFVSAVLIRYVVPSKGV
jgi:OFA family oxalate/formate antiporter-like MFS transporter